MHSEKNDELAVVIHNSVCIISNCLSHSFEAIYTFQKEAIKFLKISTPYVEKAVHFSDDVSGQYKKSKNFVNLRHQ